MKTLPEIIRSRFRPASTAEIQSWSYGAVSARRRSGSSDWKIARKTLDDEAIFGPQFDYRCPCGKYDGSVSEFLVCDVCGTAITKAASRRQRFGHIILTPPLERTACGVAAPIEAFPVLPATIRASTDGSRLNELYEELLDENQKVMPHDRTFAQFVESLSCIIEAALRWDLEDLIVLATGLALVDTKSAKRM